MIKVSDYIMKYLEKYTNVDTVFYLCGGGSMHLVDSLGKSKLKSIPCLHEQAAVIAADGYAQCKNSLGVALVTTGPGSTNAITGVAGAWTESTPLLIISGQVKTNDLKKPNQRQNGVQEIDIVTIVRSITKFAYTLQRAEDIKTVLDCLISTALSARRGPVWLDVPLDLQGKMVDEDLLNNSAKDIGENLIDNTINNIENVLNSDKIIEIIKKLNESKRPVIIAGNGIRLANGIESFSILADTLHIPILPTWRVMDFLDENEPLYAGRFGCVGQRGANFIVQNSDFVLSIGARLDMVSIGYNFKNFAPNAYKVIIDCDSEELNKFSGLATLWKQDAKLAIERILETLVELRGYAGNEFPLTNRKDWINKCIELRAKYPVCLKEYYCDSYGSINPYVFIENLSDICNENDIIVCGSSGMTADMFLQSFKVKKGQRIFSSPGLGSMGFGLPHSIGAYFSTNCKAERIICIIGDGGLQHNIQELELLSRYNIPIKLIVFNNNGYNSIRHMQNRVFKGHKVGCDKESGLTLPSSGDIAEAYGLQHEFIFLNEKDHIIRILNKSFEQKEPILIEVLINDKVEMQPKLTTKVGADGTITSAPLDDLYPFLPKEEFDKMKEGM